MELRQIRYFLMLAEELHYKRAAEKLFIVQPALTKQIQDLEKELGIQLFKRNKRNVALTEAGQYFKTQAGPLLDSLLKLKAETALVADGEKGELRIGYVGSCIHTFLPELLKLLHRNYPQVQTYLSEMTSAMQAQALQMGQLDIAFLRNPFPVRGFESKLVFSETFSLVLPQNHSINSRNFKGMSQLANEMYILPTKKDGEQYHRLQWSICEDAGFRPIIAHETVHGFTTLKLVENGFGISLLPTSFKKVTTAPVKFIELKKISQRAEISAMWDITNANPTLKRFLKYLK